VILATGPDLQKLSDDIRRLSETGRGRVDHHVTEEKNPTSRGSVVFEVISEEELSALQRGDSKHRLLLLMGPAILIVGVALAIYGGYSLFQRLISALTP
jgi:hypothetical protein